MSYFLYKGHSSGNPSPFIKLYYAMTCYHFIGLHPATRGSENPMHVNVFAPFNTFPVWCILCLVMAFWRSTRANGGNGLNTHFSGFILYQNSLSFPEMPVGLLEVSRRGTVFQTSLVLPGGQSFLWPLLAFLLNAKYVSVRTLTDRQLSGWESYFGSTARWLSFGRHRDFHFQGAQEEAGQSF